MVTSLYSEPIPVTEITSDWRKFHFPRDSRVITCVNLNLGCSSFSFVFHAMIFRKVGEWEYKYKRTTPLSFNSRRGWTTPL